MKTSRFSRFLTVIVAILSLLYMQFAVASYVCPGQPMDGLRDTASAGAMAIDMPNCQGMDATQPALCHLHGHDATSKQSLDKTPMPDVPPFVPATLVLSLQLSNIAAASANAPHVPVALTHATAPPIAIRHCCFRI
ncbi:hypothetical protein [Duganella violaceipulchra]|uniref:Copper resistance protein n=1 Tax=Duganella violaceipulchra TaxID=2849652 RepID=A0AA41HGI5_9BURK|nr:hypothetical protein [Duganella violaceicalia]MBV6323751.1 hypothetical protein [Duganella violaceicalia]MCP2007440.1 hypothetical protein [Duganella violaceicalia]